MNLIVIEATGQIIYLYILSMQLFIKKKIKRLFFEYIFLKEQLIETIIKVISYNKKINNVAFS